jgi:hypothetical protein
MNFEDECTNVALKLQGKSLNLLEEAQLLQSLRPRRRSLHGCTLREIGRRLNRSYSWVARRLVLLTLPKEIQQAATQGLFKSKDLMLIASIKPSLRNRAACKLLQDRKNGKIPGALDLRHRHTRQSPKHIKQMIKYLTSKGVGGLTTRILAWCLGKVDDHKIYAEVREAIKDGELHGTAEDVPFPGRIDGIPE